MDLSLFPSACLLTGGGGHRLSASVKSGVRRFEVVAVDGVEI